MKLQDSGTALGVASPFEALLVTGAGWLLTACCLWLGGILLAGLLETVTSGRLRATTWLGCPPRLRHALLTGLGLALASVGTAQASFVGLTDGAPLPVPVRPHGTADEHAPLVVRPGDSLWRLAAADLAPGAQPRHVAARVSSLHRLNREVIGPDPDLIRPGQRLDRPPLPRRHPHTPHEERP